MKKLKWIALIIVVFIVAITAFVDYTIDKSTDGAVYNNLTLVPHNRTGLLLGTSKYLNNGSLNYYFVNRIRAAVDLFNSGRIEFIVISGDNSRKDYNEPLDMSNELIRLGLPKEKIFLDYAGFNTYDSVIRLSKIFGQRRFTVISQEFHNRRAVFIAKNSGLDAVGYNAADIDQYNGFKTKLREKFARIKAIIDLTIRKEPHFLGKKIEIAYLHQNL